MTQPAIYVVLRDGRWFHTGHNIAGYEVDQVLALGNDVALRYIDGLVHRGPDDAKFWDAYCTAGALIDFDRRMLLVFTDMLDYGMRTAFLDGLTRTWPGWQIRWAYGWLADLAAHPGVEPPKVCEPWDQSEEIDRLPDLHEHHYRAVVTVSDSRKGSRAYEVDASDVPEPWWIGPRLLDLLREDQRCSQPSRMPDMGMHLDADTATAGVWTTQYWPGLQEQFPRLWPGWSLELWDDRCDEQVTRARGALHLPPVALDAELSRYGKRLDDLWINTLREQRSDPIDLDYPAFVVGLPRVDYQRQRGIAITRHS